FNGFLRTRSGHRFLRGVDSKLATANEARQRHGANASVGDGSDSATSCNTMASHARIRASGTVAMLAKGVFEWSGTAESVSFEPIEPLTGSWQHRPRRFYRGPAAFS